MCGHFVVSVHWYIGKRLAILQALDQFLGKLSKWSGIIALFACGSEHYVYRRSARLRSSGCFPPAMCDLHHQTFGYMTKLWFATGENTCGGRPGFGRRSPQRGVDGIQQGIAGKGFFEEGDAALQDFAFRDQFPGVAGHVHDFEVRVRSGQAIYQFRTTHPLHHDIGQQQINLTRMRLRPFERGFPVIRFYHGVAVLLEELSRQAAHDFIIFDQ